MVATRRFYLESKIKLNIYYSFTFIEKNEVTFVSLNTKEGILPSVVSLHLVEYKKMTNILAWLSG